MATVAKRRSVRRRALDVALYIAIAVGIYAGALWIADRGTGDMPARWYELGLFTTVLFGETVARYRAFARHVGLWFTLLSAMALHVAIFVFILNVVGDWKAIWWALSYVIESMILNAMLSFFGFHRSALVEVGNSALRSSKAK